MVFNDNSSYSDNTIFDDVFKTMIIRIPELVIPVINEIFNTDYSENISFEQLGNEHYTKDGKIITDSIFKIKDVIYHIECQRRKDSRMVIRMIEYDFSIALNDLNKEDGEYVIRMPKSCVLHLDTSKIEDELNMKIITSDGQLFPYKTKVIKVQNYSKNEIFEKRLLLFLPFYIIRYQSQYNDIENDNERYEAFVNEFIEINTRLGEVTAKSEKSGLYNDLIGLITKIADYMLVNQTKLKKGVDDAMGGQVLELESERLMKLGSIKTLLKLNYSADEISKIIDEPIEKVESVINSLDENEK
jgi:hypothetical protein